MTNGVKWEGRPGNYVVTSGMLIVTATRSSARAEQRRWKWTIRWDTRNRYENKPFALGWAPTRGSCWSSAIGAFSGPPAFLAEQFAGRDE